MKRFFSNHAALEFILIALAAIALVVTPAYAAQSESHDSGQTTSDLAVTTTTTVVPSEPEIGTACVIVRDESSTGCE